MIVVFRSGGLLLVAGALVIVAVLPARAAAEEGATSPAPAQGVQGAESASTTPTESSGAPTLTVEPPPTPPPVHAGATSPAPKVHVQHAQGATRGAPAQPKHARARARRPGTKSAPAARPNGPSAVSPSAITPPLPLALSSPLAGIPTFFIESFRIPPFLLPIFQAAGTAYGVPWQVLAAINEVETDYGRDLSLSSAGAEGWMQFLPSSWATYGVDATGDGFKDPYNPADAIFAAARYLRAAGAATNLRGAIFAYNHSQAYVESVLLRARLLGGTPAELVGSLTGLTQARFPVHAAAHFSDGFPGAPGGSGTLPGTVIYSLPDAPVIAVQDGLITRLGRSPQLGLFVSLRDAFGNTYTYAQLGRIARDYPVLQPHEASLATISPAREAAEPHPTAPASAGVQPQAQTQLQEAGPIGGFGLGGAQAQSDRAGAGSPGSTARAAAPVRPTPAPPGAGGASAPAAFRAGPDDVFLHPLRAGVRVIAGTVLGHLAGAGSAAGGEPHMLFQIRPAGAGAPLIDPKPILDGWVALENTSVYHAAGPAQLRSSATTPGRVLLESKQQLQLQVLANRAIALARCTRQDVQGGRADRRVLATLEFLAVSGLRLSAGGLACTDAALGGAAAAAQQSAEAVDITAVDGVAIAGHQGAGSVGEALVRKLLTFQGTMRPRQIIGLRHYPGASNVVPSPSHSERITISFQAPVGAGGRVAATFSSGVTPSQWIQLIARLGEIPNPVVRSGHSSASIPDSGAAQGAFDGDH